MVSITVFDIHLYTGKTYFPVCVPQLVSVLREVKYLDSRQTETIPNTAADIYASKESLRQYVANLDLTAGWYNKVIRSVLEVEFPLVEGQLRAIDTQFLRAEESANWRSDGKLLKISWLPTL